MLRYIVLSISSILIVSLCAFATENPPAPTPAPAPQEPAPAAEPAPLPAPTEAAPAPAATEWTLEKFNALAEATGRKMTMTQGTFDSVQKRKEPAIARIEKYLAGHFGTADTRVLDAFRTLPREYFHYNYEGKYSTAASTYETDAKPWGIGYGSALSDYLGQAYMTQLSNPQPTDVVLEIGTGSGFQSSLLSRLTKEVYTIEIIKPLGEAVAGIIKAGGYDNVQQRVGDGYYGWPEVEGGFDIIMVTCAALYVPPALLEQLKPGTGRLIIPVGPAIRGKQILYVYTKDADGKVRSKRDVGVYFIPMTGAMQEKPKPGATPEKPKEAPAQEAATPAATQ